MSRREEFSKDGEGSPYLTMPDLDEAAYLVLHWKGAGMVSRSADGIIPLTWQELESFIRLQELELDNFELNSIRLLSEEYCGEYHAASGKNHPAPYSITEEELDRTAISNKISNVFAGLKMSKNEPRYTVEDRN